ncbi:BgTH12-02242, partial [Blumeria graminis f. sp. triticale]
KELYVIVFQKLLEKFTISLQGLKKLRKTLFKDDGRYIRTPKDYGPLYRGMIKALDKTIEDIRGRIRF